MNLSLNWTIRFRKVDPRFLEIIIKLLSFNKRTVNVNKLDQIIFKNSAVYRCVPKIFVRNDRFPKISAFQIWIEFSNIRSFSAYV